MKEDRGPFDAFVDELRADAPSMEASQMFGKPCARLAGQKPVLSWFQGAMVFRLGAERANQLIAAHSECVAFDPSGKGRPFKDWVQVARSPEINWRPLALEALGLA